MSIYFVFSDLNLNLLAVQNFENLPIQLRISFNSYWKKICLNEVIRVLIFPAMMTEKNFMPLTLGHPQLKGAFYVFWFLRIQFQYTRNTNRHFIGLLWIYPQLIESALTFWSSNWLAFGNRPSFEGYMFSPID